MLKSKTLADIVLALAGRIVPGALAVLAIPFYLQSLGPERYAGIGFYLTFQLIVGLLDFGLSSSVLREASWLTGQSAPAHRFWTLLRTFEIPFWAFTCLVTLIGLAAGAPLLRAVFSVDLAAIGLDSPASALLFASIAFRFPFAVYYGYLSGCGYVARANVIVLVFDSMRTIGMVVLLLFLPPSLMLFFTWHAISAIAISVVGFWAARLSTPSTREPVPVEWQLYKDLQKLALGAGALSVLFVVANSIDKIFLPRFLAVADYGLYVAVGQLAVIIFIVTQAIWSAQHPRLLMALASGSSDAASSIYLNTATMISSLCCATILTVWLSAPAIIAIWLPSGGGKTFAGVLIALTIGNAAAALSHLALTIQHAAKTMLPMLLVLAVAIIAMPLVVLLTYGDFTPLSGALAWAGIYVASFLGGIATYSKHCPAFLAVWCRVILLPLLFTVSLAPVLSQWTYAAPNYLQLAMGLGAGMLALAANLAGNRQIRETMRSIIFVILVSRDKAEQR